jgi:hypothetical protein
MLIIDPLLSGAIDAERRATLARFDPSTRSRRARRLRRRHARRPVERGFVGADPARC